MVPCKSRLFARKCFHQRIPGKLRWRTFPNLKGAVPCWRFLRPAHWVIWSKIVLPDVSQEKSGIGLAGAADRGCGQMIKVIIDAVLFSCMAAFITGVVLVAVNFIS